MSPASGSVVDNVPTTVPAGRFSATEAPVIVISVGPSSTLVTVTATAFVAVSAPSLTCTVTS